MSRTRQPSTRRIGAAERAITVLDTLAEAGELGTNEIARRTGMTPSTVSRQLGTLAASGLVERVDATGRYRLGIRVVHLANAVLARLDVREVARPHLVALVEATGETATLSVPGDEDAITVDFVPGSHQIQPVSRLGRPSIAHATSAGKVMLAFSGRELPDGPFRAYTTRTITDRRVSRAGDRARASTRLRTGGGGARAGTHRDRRADPLGTRRARGDRRAPGPERALRRARRRVRAPRLVARADSISRELGWRPL